MPLPELSPELIQAAQHGDQGAFEHIVSIFEKPLFRYIYRMTNTVHDAEDLTQETFVKVYRNLGRFDRSKRFSTWIFTIATRTTYDWLRRRRLRPELLVDTPPETSPPLTSYKSVDIRLDIGEALANIRPEYRSALLLYYMEGYSYQEIAETLATPVNTVKTYISRGKTALRHLIERDE